MKVMSIMNQKGGVGKTTTAINFSAALGLLGKKVLLIDLDPQANTTIGLGFDKNNLLFDIFDFLINDIPFSKVVLKTKANNVSLLPSSINLAGIDLILSNKTRKENESILRDKLKEISKKYKYDYVLIDCSPSLGLLNKNALVSSDSVLIPVQPQYYALEGLTQLLSTISIIKKLFNPKLVIEFILITMYKKKLNLHKETYEEIKKFFKDIVSDVLIPENTDLGKAAFHGKSIFDYDKKAAGAKAYYLLAQEFLQNEAKR